MTQGIHKQDHNFLPNCSKVISKKNYFWYLMIAPVGGTVTNFGMFPHTMVLMPWSLPSFVSIDQSLAEIQPLNQF